MSCDLGKATEGLKNELWHRWSDRKVGEWAELLTVTFWNLSVTSPTSQFILQPFSRFSYVTISSLNSPDRAHSRTLSSLHLRHNSFSNLSDTWSTSQLILQPFRRYTYVTAHSPTLPLLHLCHSSFSNPPFDSPTSQALHLIHLASRPCILLNERRTYLTRECVEGQAT